MALIEDENEIPVIIPNRPLPSVDEVPPMLARPDEHLAIDTRGGDQIAQAQQVASEAEQLAAQARASIQARSAAASQGMGGAAEIAQGRANAGRQQANDAFNLAGQRVKSSHANPAAPSTKKMVGTMLGGQPRVVTDPFGEPVPEMETVDEVIVGSDGQPMLDPMNPQGPPLTRRVTRPTGRPMVERNPGLVQEGRDAAALEGQQAIQTARVQTDLLQHEAQSQAALTDQIQRREQMRQQRIEQQRQAVDSAYTAVQKANTDLQKSKEVDPDKGWNDKGTAAKVMAVIASGLLGIAGMDPFVHIRSVIEDSMAAQKANHDRLRSRVDSAQGVQQASGNLLGHLRTQLGDEALADEAYRLTMLQDIKAQSLATLSNAQVQEMTAAQSSFMNGLDQQIAETRRRLELTAATTPDRITSSRSPYTSEQRAMLKAEHAAGLKSQETGGSQVVETVGKAQEQMRGIEGKVREEQAKADAAGGPNSLEERKFRFEQKKNLTAGEKAAAVSAALGATDQYLADYGDDIPGRSEVGVGGKALIEEPNVFGWRPFQSDESRREMARRGIIGKWYATALTGANVSATQEAFLSDLVEDENLSGDAIRSGLNDLRQTLLDIEEQKQRSIEDVAEGEYRGVDPSQMPDRAPKTGGRLRGNTSVEQEADLLGGKLR